MLINKEYMIDQLGVNTPGVGNYKPIIPNTFEDIRLKNNTIDPTSSIKKLNRSNSKSPGTFTTGMRFFEPSSVMTLRSQL